MIKSKPTTNYKIAYSVQEIDSKNWNAITTNTLFLDLNYLKAIEQTVSEVYQFIYVIYYNETNEPIGKSIFQVLQYDVSTFNFDSIPCNFKNKILRRFLNKKITILIAGNIFVTGENGFNFDKKIGKDVVFNKMNQVINHLLKSNKTINYVVFKEFYPTNKNANLLVKKYNYLKFNIDVNMVLKLNKQWQSFNDILTDFKTKYRSRSNGVLKKSEKLTVKEFTLSDIKNNADKFEKLYQQVLKNSNFNIGIFNIETFLNLKRNLKDKYTIFVYFNNDEFIGFRSAFEYNNSLETSFIGIDYKLNLKYNLYQRILIDYINYGLKQKVKKIGFGRTAETIKSCVGAEPIEMNLFVKSQKRTGKFLLKMIVNNIKASSFTQRKPFKQKFYN